MQKIAALLLILALSASSGGCMCSYLTYKGVENALKTPVPTAAPEALDYGTGTAEHSDVAFSDMQYTRPDLDELEDAIEDLLNDLDKGGNPEDLFDRYDHILSLYDNADSQMSFCYLLYALDVTDQTYQDEYADLVERLSAIDLDMTDLSIAMLDSESFGDEARARWGDDYADTVIEDEGLNSEEIQPFIKEEQQLTFQYDKLISSFKLRDSGRDWSPNDMVAAYFAGEIGYEDYVKLYDEYNQQLNEKAGALYLKLLALRNQVSTTLGFADYAEYCYASYARDFTLDDAKGLHAAVKEYIVPVYQKHAESSAAMYTLKDQTFALDGYLATLQRVVKDFSPEMLETLNYMLRNHLYDFEDTENKMEGSFTTYLDNYKAPFILSHWTGSSADVRTVMHEFGHFCRFYQDTGYGWSETDPLDLAEVDSQGFELLMSNYDNRFFGANVNAATSELLSDAMYAVLSGCMEDEFQQEIYQNPGMTLEELNDLYRRIAEEYGFVELYGFTGTEWVQIPHTFQSPMYYISYATSMILSLELWKTSLTDFDAARDAYLSILNRPAYSELRRTATENGMGDPLSAESVRGIAEALSDRLFED